MKRPVLFVIVFSIVAVVAVLLGAVFVATRVEERRPQGSVAENGGSPRSEGGVSNFFKIGNIVSSGSGWKMVYEEPGRPALSAELVFSDDSICVGTESLKCDVMVFTEGQRVAMEGMRIDEARVLVRKVAPSF